MPGCILIGGVGQLLQGDLDLGRLAADALATEDLGTHVLVEELHYGAVAVAQRLQELDPIGLILIGATEVQAPAGAKTGAVRRRRVRPRPVDPVAAQVAISEAGTGYVGIDLIIDVARALEALPARTVVIEVDPVTVGPGLDLSTPARTSLGRAVASARDEAMRLPMLDVADRLRLHLAESRLEEPRRALGTTAHLLDQLDVLDAHGEWGQTYRWRDRLRHDMAADIAADDGDRAGWGLGWQLIEALDQLEAAGAG